MWRLILVVAISHFRNSSCFHGLPQGAPHFPQVLNIAKETSSARARGWRSVHARCTCSEETGWIIIKGTALRSMPTRHHRCQYPPHSFISSTSQAFEDDDTEYLCFEVSIRLGRSGEGGGEGWWILAHSSWVLPFLFLLLLSLPCATLSHVCIAAFPIVATRRNIPTYSAGASWCRKWERWWMTWRKKYIRNYATRCDSLQHTISWHEWNVNLRYKQNKIAKKNVNADKRLPYTLTVIR